MELVTAGVPVVLPGKGKPGPVASGPETWGDNPLVRISTTYRYDRFAETFTRAYRMDERTSQYIPLEGAFLDAVEAASKLASNWEVRHPRSAQLRDPNEWRYSGAFAVLQAADGAYWAVRLDGATIDAERENLVVENVERVHRDVRAVVGAYSWVDFTGTGSRSRQLRM